jgi:hypothetical protein
MCQPGLPAQKKMKNFKRQHPYNVYVCEYGEIPVAGEVFAIALPAPQGLGQLGSPGFDRFHRAKSLGDRFSWPPALIGTGHDGEFENMPQFGSRTNEILSYILYMISF